LKKMQTAAAHSLARTFAVCKVKFPRRMSPEIFFNFIPSSADGGTLRGYCLSRHIVSALVLEVHQLFSGG
jgi:hypothetical protein